MHQQKSPTLTHREWADTKVGPEQAKVAIIHGWDFCGFFLQYGHSQREEINRIIHRSDLHSADGHDEVVNC